MTLWNGYLLHTKGTVLLVCFQCIDTLELCRNMPKVCPHVVMRFVPSLIVAGMNHRISSRFTQIQREDYLWEFVLIRGRKKHLFNPLKIH